MKLLALQPAPASTCSWIERANCLRQEQHRLASELCELLAGDVKELDVERASALVQSMVATGGDLLGLVLEDLRFWQWAAAAWYYRATGCHVETGCGTSESAVKINGNVYDIKEVLAQQRR